MRKRWTLIPTDEKAVEHLQDVLHIHPALCRVLVQRGITSLDTARSFFRPQLSDLHDPFLMKGMLKAVARLRRAIDRNEKVLLYGDYDVDGTTSVAMMFEFLSKKLPGLDYYLPDRQKEGYGISAQGVNYAGEQGVSLVLAMDCGIQALQPVQQAQALGIDFIICDHHLPADKLPPAVAILDPLQADCPYPFKGLSGCGVAFKLAQGLTQDLGEAPDALWDLLDLLVLSIAADIVPMTGENRILAHYGLQRLNRTERPGLAALIEHSGRSRPLDINDIVFGLAPRINAAGRLDAAADAVKLMLSFERVGAEDYARLLSKRNNLRKSFNDSMVEEARKMFEALQDHQQRSTLVLYNANWHKGIVGIAAARMVEQFCRPSILLCESNGVAVGSARSVPGFDVHQAIAQCDDLLLAFGGHEHAAGLTLPLDNIALFVRRFEDVVRATIPEELLIPEVKVNAVLNLDEIIPSFWKVLKQFAPFGPGNRRPVFVAKKVRDTGHSRLLKGEHLRLSVRQEKGATWMGIAFGKGEFIHSIKQKKSFHLAFNVEEDNWQGRRALRLLVKDLWI